MKKRVLGFLISVCMVLSNTSVSVCATEIETSSSARDIVYTDDTAAGMGTGTAADPYQDFETALANVADGGTIIIGAGGAYVGTDGTNDLMPLVIDKAVTIKSETGSDLVIRRAGIILGADVTFENMAFALANKEKNAIFANGHTLTLTNVTRLSGTREVHLFAGGVAGSTAAMGSHGCIVINGSAAQFGNIYAGSMNQSSDLPVTITINGTTSMSLGNIYACGARTGVYDANDLFSGTEPEAPAPSEVAYPVNSKVTIELNKSNVTNVYGLASSTNKADVSFSAVYPNYNLELSDIGTLTVKSGKLIPKSLNEDLNVSINSGAYLDLSAVMTENAFSVTDFVGGGTLQLGKDDTLTVKGNISGVTAFEVADDNVLTGSGIAKENHGYIDATAATGDGTFTFVPYATQDGMTIEKKQGVWTTVMSTSPNVVSVDIGGTVTEYPDIETAWNTVCESDTAISATITLLDHVEVAGNTQLVLANSNVNVTLDLDGYLLWGNGASSDGKNGLLYVSEGSLTVQDSYDGSYGILDEYPTDGCAIYVDGGSLTVLSGIVEGQSCGIKVAGGTVSLAGGTIRGIEVTSSTNQTVGDLLASGYGYKTSAGWITDTGVKLISGEVEVQKQDPEQNPEENPEENPEQNPEENPEQNPEGNPEENPEQNPEENPEQNPEENPEQNPEENPEENPEQNPEENPGQGGETAPAVTIYNGVDYAAVYDFDYYMSTYSDLKAGYGNNREGALAHFVNHGMAEGRQAKEDFNVQTYRARYADLRKGYGNDLKGYFLHYIYHGKAEGRSGAGSAQFVGETIYNGIDYAAVYDYNFYISKYPDLKKGFNGDENALLQHFVEHGMAEGRQGSAEFDVQAYMNRYEDLHTGYGNDLKGYYLHYLQAGKAEGRNGAPFSSAEFAGVYDFATYMSINQDLSRAYGTDEEAALKHFALHGMKEGRQASEEFNVYAYRNRYKDLQAGYGTDLRGYYLHYVNAGRKEGRDGRV